MDSKVLVVFVKHTGHVLAAMTRTADADSTAKLEQVVDPSLKVRLLAPATTLGVPAELEFVIPREQLGTMLAEGKPNLLSRPRTFKVEDPTKENSDLVNLPVRGANPTTGEVLPDPILSQNDIQVIMTYHGVDPPTVATPVWVFLMRNAENTQIVRGEIRPSEITVTIPLQIPVPVGENRDVLVLAGKSALFAIQLAAV